jgi:7-carboxy-7-deazaguanine synthase
MAVVRAAREDTADGDFLSRPHAVVDYKNLPRLPSGHRHAPWEAPAPGRGGAAPGDRMSYSVKEIFYSLQGEGAQSGRPAVFCRFAGCNLWSGREQDRATAQCRFCDTDFVGTDGTGGGKYASADTLADAIAAHWPEAARPGARPYVVCTGGEPLLQLDEALCAALHARDFELAVETNGTVPLRVGVDWVCVSPKAGAEQVLAFGNELKLVYPQEGLSPADFEGLAFEYFYLQPMDGPDRDRNTALALRYCLEHPQWRLSLQTHKLLGIP